MGVMRSLVSFLGGAASVGLVVGVLALAGVIDDDGAQTQARAPGATATAPAPAPSSGTSRQVAATPTDVSQIYKRVAPGVAFVSSSQSGGGNRLLGGGSAATGSGFVWDTQGHVVTNDHVVSGFDTFRVRIGSSQKTIPAKLVGTDPSSDLAVLKIDPSAVAGELHLVPVQPQRPIQRRQHGGLVVHDQDPCHRSTVIDAEHKDQRRARVFSIP